jgi:hypothetical protein
VILLAMALLAASPAQGQVEPAPVAEFGGKARVGGKVVVLDSGKRAPRLLWIEPSTMAVREQALDLDGVVLTPYGLAVEASGILVAIADKGRRIVRFSRSRPEPIEESELPAPCGGIWSLSGGLVVAPIQTGDRKPLLARLTRNGWQPFGFLSPREATSPETRIAGNLVRCGFETDGALPCWYVARGDEVFFLRPDGRLRRLRAPSLATEPPPTDNSAGPAEIVGSWRYPIRDVHRVDGGDFWVLTNQEGAIPPGQAGAVRGRHVLLVNGATGREVRRVALPREGKVILDGTSREIVVLYADGRIGKVRSP